MEYGLILFLVAACVLLSFWVFSLKKSNKKLGMGCKAMLQLVEDRIEPDLRQEILNDLEKHT